MGLHQRYCSPERCLPILRGRTETRDHLLYRGGNALNQGPKKGVVVQTEWEWPIVTDLQKHHERVALLRPVPFEMTTQVDSPSDMVRSGKALSLNISSGGMLVLMDHAPEIEQVLKVLVPTPTSLAGTPTLAEVRWTRRVPFGRQNGQGTYFVGLKFIF
jgi:PilZ domain-containing protein